jgi:glyoxylase-like metal-dependent hydrolase (beta-lactamase superfamily II)
MTSILGVRKTSWPLGDFSVCPLPTGEFGLDGGAMFGTVPRVLWEKSNPPDAQNRILMEARGLLLKAKDRKIVIDCGNGGDFVDKYGEKLGSKFQEMYNIDPAGPSLLKSMAAFGVKPEDVTDVILTHLHFDHCGGGTTVKDGKLVPTFPNAQYYVQRANLETAQTPNLRERASYYPANFEPLLAAGVLKLLDGPVENLLPGISVAVSNGHTQGQQYVKITSGGQTLVYCGDVIPTSSHVRLAWVMGYDLEPLKLIEEKRKILDQAARENWYLYFEHDPYCDAAQVQAQGSDFVVKERIWIEANATA